MQHANTLTTPATGATATQTLDAIAVKSKQLTALLTMMASTNSPDYLEQFDSITPDLKAAYVGVMENLAAEITALAEGVQHEQS